MLSGPIILTPRLLAQVLQIILNKFLMKQTNIKSISILIFLSYSGLIPKFLQTVLINSNMQSNKF